MTFPLEFKTLKPALKSFIATLFWMISPALPVIGLGILAGYHFGPRPLKKVFALGGPL
ncbi:hypothetical protein RFY15_12430, partial [Acinetobacter baumannii]|nr:hypothetical protein [Acinetobacter baumannii]